MTAKLEHPTDTMGELIKKTRLEQGISREALAERAGISVRYMTAIENENRNPSYPILSRILQSLGLSADSIFYPQMEAGNSDLEQLIRLLHTCTEKELNLIRSLTQTIIDHREQDQE